LKLSIGVILLFFAFFGVVFFLNKMLFLRPLRVVQKHAVLISNCDEHLGDQMQLGFLEEWNGLANALNKMSTQLKADREDLKMQISKATAKLEETNEKLKLDIVAREQIEDALRAERDKAQQYLDVAGNMFVAINIEGIVTLINKKRLRSIGL